MGEALLGGLVASGWSPTARLAVVETTAERRTLLSERFPHVAVLAEVPSAEGAVVAVKPGDVEAACRSLAMAGCPRVLSIAAGVRLERLESWLGPGVAVVRAMPNTPALVNLGASAIAGGTEAGADDLAWAEGVLSAVGLVERVGEELLDAVTGLSGSGPAYVFLVVEALIEAGVAVGLPKPVSRALVVRTVAGAARLLEASGEEPEVLRAAVTSPGGTTAAGLRSLEIRAVREAFLEAVLAATERSRELGST